MTTEYVDTRPEDLSVQRPASDVSEAVANVRRTRRTLQQAAGPQPSQHSTPPQVRPFRPVTQQQGPPGIPAAVLAPTDQPDVPVNTPLRTAPAAPLPPDQDRLAFLDRLANDPRVSPTTREWARLVLEDLLIG